MKTQKFLFDLNCKFAIYVPTTDNISDAVDNSAQVDKVLRTLSGLFGGATATPAVGAWVMASGEVVREKIDIVYSYCTSEQAAEYFDEVVSLCEWLKGTMHQEAVTLEYNGQVKFI